jgi:hypothetical protein
MHIPSPSSGKAGVLLVAPRHRSPKSDEQGLIILVQSARAGDHDAWTRLVQRFDRMLHQIARSYRLPSVDVEDVVQMTWLDLFQAIDSDPRTTGHRRLAGDSGAPQRARTEAGVRARTADRRPGSGRPSLRQRAGEKPLGARASCRSRGVF